MKELISLTFVCRLCFEITTVERTREMVEFLGYDPDKIKGTFSFIVCKDCKEIFGGYFETK